MSHPSERVASRFSLIRILTFAALAAVFAAAPKPAFAQHGGGGHSGGGHASGGGGGHVSGGSHSAPMGSTSHSSGPASHAVVGGAHGVSGGVIGSHAANVNAMTNHFVTPEGAAASRAAVRAMVRSTNQPLVAQERVRRFGRPVFFFGNGCFNGFFPSFCGFSPFFGLGFGFGPGCWGAWGWDGFGFPPDGCGYGGGWDYTNYGYPYTPSMSAEIEDNVEHPREYEPRNELVPYPSSGDESQQGGAEARAEQPLMMLYLKDGTVYALANYWVAGGQLHYVTQYGGENTVPMEQLDIQKTVDVNARRGVTVTLKPAPEP